MLIHFNALIGTFSVEKLLIIYILYVLSINWYRHWFYKINGIGILVYRTHIFILFFFIYNIMIRSEFGELSSIDYKYYNIVFIINVSR